MSLSEFFRNNNIQLVHAHFLPDADKLVSFCRREHVPLIVTAHGFDAAVFDDIHRSKRRNELKLYASAIVCVSDFIRRTLIELDYDPKRLICLPLGIDLSMFDYNRPSVEMKGIIAVARLVEKKGIEYLIRAYSQLTQSVRDRHPLTIIGDGPLREHLASVAAETNSTVRFLGEQNRKVAIDLVSKSRIFCLPSIRSADGDAEGMPIALMEAMALGIPTIFFETQHMSDTIAAAEAGLGCKYKSTDDLADSLSDVLASDEKHLALSLSGRRFCEENFDLRLNISKLEDLYTAVLFKR